jgi:surface protein
MFNGATDFNKDISVWNTSNVTSMKNMFANASLFNLGDLSGHDGTWHTDPANGIWDTSSVTTIESMFQGCNAFNRDMRQWNLSGLTGGSSPIGFNLFKNSQYFEVVDSSGWVRRVPTSIISSSNGQYIPWTRAGLLTATEAWYPPPDASGTSSYGDVSNFNTFLVTDMNSLFRGDQGSVVVGIAEWNTARVTTMANMFNDEGSYATFISDIGSWNTAKVTDMESMFSFTSVFNQDISGWNVSNVTNMAKMFEGATAFNQNIGSWNVSNVTNMANMFSGSTFNEDIGNWDVSNVTDMGGMFMEAESFDQNIGSWLPNPSAYYTAADTPSQAGMFSGSVAFCASATNAYCPWNKTDNIDPLGNDWSKTNLGGHWC